MSDLTTTPPKAAGETCGHRCPAHPDWTSCQRPSGHDPEYGHRDSTGTDVQHAWQDQPAANRIEHAKPGQLAGLPCVPSLHRAPARHRAGMPLACQRSREAAARFGTIGNPLGTPLPHRLEPGAQCYAVVDLATAMAVVDAPLRDKTLGRMVWPVVQFGNGRKREGMAVEIPVKPDTAAPSAGPA